MASSHSDIVIINILVIPLTPSSVAFIPTAIASRPLAAQERTREDFVAARADPKIGIAIVLSSW
jgi:hypothetical protein